MATFSRRGLLQGTLAASARTVLPVGTAAGPLRPVHPSTPGLVRRRLHLPSGIATGNVTSRSVVLWSRTDGTGRMVARLRAVDAEGTPLRGAGSFDRTLTSGWATDATDHTARIGATALPPGTRFALEVRFEDDRYTVRDVDTLAARGRWAWQEYQPIGNARALRPGTTGFEDQRIHRRIERGPQLDVFCLDMRTFKGENTAGRKSHATPLLGEEQVQWLVDGVTSSRATWR